MRAFVSKKDLEVSKVICLKDFVSGKVGNLLLVKNYTFIYLVGVYVLYNRLESAGKERRNYSISNTGNISGEFRYKNR